MYYATNTCIFYVVFIELYIYKQENYCAAKKKQDARLLRLLATDYCVAPSGLLQNIHMTYQN